MRLCYKAPMRNIALLLGALLALACNKPNKPEPASEAAPAPTPAPSAAPAPSPAPAEAPSAGGLTWNDAAPLVRRKPKSSMRAAEYGIEGDDRAELTVFYFGPDQGGSIDANLSRWYGQFTQPDGSDTAAKAKRSEVQVGSIAVTKVEAEGNYSGGMGMPGGPAPTPIEGALLLGAIARGPQGAVFFKLVGPRETLEQARPAFDALIASLRSAP